MLRLEILHYYRGAEVLLKAQYFNSELWNEAISGAITRKYSVKTGTKDNFKISPQFPKLLASYLPNRQLRARVQDVLGVPQGPATIPISTV